MARPFPSFDISLSAYLVDRSGVGASGAVVATVDLSDRLQAEVSEDDVLAASEPEARHESDDCQNTGNSDPDKRKSFHSLLSRLGRDG